MRRMTTLAVADHVSAYFWSISHVVGAVVMACGWRKYRQRFFMWMTATWAIQTLGGITREQFSPDVQTMMLVGLRVVVTATSFAAFYYGLILVRRKLVVTVLSVEGNHLHLREGMENRAITVPDLLDEIDEHDRITPRPPFVE
jgi:hypothetical protein